MQVLDQVLDAALGVSCSICPTFSGSVIRPTRSATRSATGRAGSWYGAVMAMSRFDRFEVMSADTLEEHPITDECEAVRCEAERCSLYVGHRPGLKSLESERFVGKELSLLASTTPAPVAAARSCTGCSAPSVPTTGSIVRPNVGDPPDVTIGAAA